MLQQISTANQRKIIKREYTSRVLAVVLSCLALLGFLFILSLIPLYYFAEVKSNLVDQGYESIKNKNIQQSEASLNKDVREMSGLINLFKIVLEDKSVRNDLLSLIPDSAMGIKITSLSWKKETDEVFVKGVANSRNTLVSYVKGIQYAGIFDKAEVPVSNLTKSSNLTFSLGLIYKK